MIVIFHLRSVVLRSLCGSWSCRESKIIRHKRLLCMHNCILQMVTNNYFAPKVNTNSCVWCGVVLRQGVEHCRKTTKTTNLQATDIDKTFTRIKKCDVSYRLCVAITILEWICSWHSLEEQIPDFSSFNSIDWIRENLLFILIGLKAEAKALRASVRLQNYNISFSLSQSVELLHSAQPIKQSLRVHRPHALAHFNI